jgi:hypothetical protein
MQLATSINECIRADNELQLTHDQTAEIVRVQGEKMKLVDQNNKLTGDNRQLENLVRSLKADAKNTEPSSRNQRKSDGINKLGNFTKEDFDAFFNN